MKKLFVSIIALMVAAAVFAGCSQSKPAEQPKAEAPKEEAKIGTSIAGKSADGKLDVKLTVSGKVGLIEMNAAGFIWNKAFAAKEPKEPKNKDGEGHAILTLDTKEPMYVGTMRHSLSGLEPGKHTLKIVLVNNDNSPIGREVSIDFEVK